MMMRHIYLFISLLGLCLIACSDNINIEGSIDEAPIIYPDYIGVTIPCNIAPLNFHIEGSAQFAAVISNGSDEISVKASDGDVVIPPKAWRRLLVSADSLSITVCQRNDGKWMAMQPFYIYVSPDSIDPYLAYRRIPPLNVTWREIGIYQRCLEDYDELPVYQNTAYHGNCVNCHSFCNRSSQNMMFHLRGIGAATYMIHDGQKLRLDTKTDSTISNFTYPYWHPSARFVAFSVNDIFQIFHTSDTNHTEVIDDDSDVVVYDIDKNQAFSCPQLKTVGVLETFPAFSPDGHRLYFCSAARPDSLPEMYDRVQYSLCAIDFNPDSRSFGADVDTIFRSDNSSISVPRPSPDGRWIVATHSAYGNFMIWHKDADLWIYDIEHDKWSPLSEANSDDVDSYHSWSSNSRWLVFSSRRDDGLYTRPYFTHISADGSASKPFMLPQKFPKKYYADLVDSYNIPEFVDSRIPLDSRSIVDWIDSPTTKVKY